MKYEGVKFLQAHNNWARQGVEIADKALGSLLPLERFLLEVPLTTEESKIVREMREAIETERERYRGAIMPVGEFRMVDNLEPLLKKHLEIHLNGSDRFVRIIQLRNRIKEIAQRYMQTGLYKFAFSGAYSYRQMREL
jgi:hypothetical protein